MSSHILAEVSRLAKRIGIIHKGHLVQELNIDELQKNRRRRLIVRTHDIEKTRKALNAQQGILPEILPDGSIELKDTAAIEHPDDIASQLVQCRESAHHSWWWKKRNWSSISFA